MSKPGISLICSYYKWANRQEVRGATACALAVGQVIVPKVMPDKPEEFVDVYAQNDFLTITQGEGQDRVMQGFAVLSATLEPLQE